MTQDFVNCFLLAIIIVLIENLRFYTASNKNGLLLSGRLRGYEVRVMIILPSLGENLELLQLISCMTREKLLYFLDPS